MRSSLLLPVALASLLVTASAVQAVDGVVEINQSKALAGGITSGDTAGFPVTIWNDGSYRLTGDLTVNENTVAITIGPGVKDVTLDLNGFSILGPVNCTGTPIACAPAGTGEGIHSNYTGTRLRVMNGHVRGMGRYGIVIARGEIAHVESAHNGIWGISAVDGGAIVTDSVAEYNGGGGITVNTASVVRDCVSAFNGGVGIKETSSLVQGNVVQGNGGNGIYAKGGTVLDNLVQSNEMGLYVAAGWAMVTYGRNMLNGNGYGYDLYVESGATAMGMGENVCGQVACP